VVTTFSSAGVDAVSYGHPAVTIVGARDVATFGGLYSIVFVGRSPERRVRIAGDRREDCRALPYVVGERDHEPTGFDSEVLGPRIRERPRPPVRYRDMRFIASTRGVFPAVGRPRCMVRNVAGVMAELEPEDFYLLSGVEQGMRFGEWVDREKLPDLSGLTPEDVDYRLDRAMTRELIQRRTVHYEGFKLTAEGYDALALHTFAERDTVEGVGAPLGVGKESDVLEVQSYKPLALKFHREGFTEFRRVDREREYTADHHHVSPLYTARKAAEREYEVLRDLYPRVPVPRPVDHNRHAIVMEKLGGVELARARLESEQVVGVLDLVLRAMQDAHGAGYVHADMSEYNVAVGEEGVTVFDWPQAVATDHANARDLLERDVRNVLRYFDRKYPAETPDVDGERLVDLIRDGRVGSVRDV
jgi:RIO kinase 2